MQTRRTTTTTTTTGTDTTDTLTAVATYAMRLTSRESDLMPGWLADRLTFELGLDYFGCSIHLSSLVPWPNLASAQNTKTEKRQKKRRKST